MHLKMSSAECWPFCSGLNEVSSSYVLITDPLCGESTFPFQYRAGGFTTQRLHLASVENLIMQIRWSYDYLTRIAGFNTLARWHLDVETRAQGVVSLTFRELLKIISRKYTIQEMTFMMRISSWNFVHVPKAWLWAHVQSFSLKFS